MQIRNDSSQSLIDIMPQLQARSQELPTIFRRIDQLEVLYQMKLFKCYSTLLLLIFANMEQAYFADIN